MLKTAVALKVILFFKNSLKIEFQWVWKVST